MKKIFKIIVICLLAFMAFNLCESQFTFDQPAFASMGSTGGGSTGGGGGDTGGDTGGGGTTTSTDTGDDDSDTGGSYGGPDFISEFFYLVRAFIRRHPLLIAAVLGALLLTYEIKRYRSLSARLKREYGSTYLIERPGVGAISDPAWCKQVYRAQDDLFTPNQTVRHFEVSLANINMKLKENHGELDESFTEVYSQAQFLYSQLLRQKYADPRTDLSGLKQYLDKPYYKAMVAEIKLKVRSGTVDDTIVDSVKVEKYKFLDKSLILTKLDVVGRDAEVQFNQDFENSFKRSKWSDYVIFGKTREGGNYKIINLIYGEHFHLNGEDFNQVPNLDGDKYEEQKVEPPKK